MSATLATLVPSVLVYTGDGWRIEEWHYAVTLPMSLMNNPSVFCQVASNIARMHRLHKRPDFPEDIPRISATALRLEEWGKGAVEAAKCMMNDLVSSMRLEEIYPKETRWLDGWIQSKDTGITGQGIVQCLELVCELWLLRAGFSVQSQRFTGE